MKSIYFHFIYLAIIAFLGYNYWSSVQAFKAFEQLNQQLRADSGAIDEFALIMLRNVQKNCAAYKYPHNIREYKNTVIATKSVDSLMAFIDANKREFIDLNGGLDMVKYASLINGNSTKTAKIYFSDLKINQMKDKLVQLNKIFIDSIEDKWSKEKLLKACRLPQLLTENEYWHSFKTLPANAVLAQLTALQNQIKIDEIAFLNYEQHETASNYCGFTPFPKTHIAPKKAVLIEGETFEADVYLASYSNNLGSNLVIKVNGQPLEIKEGIAHFKSKNQTIGTKTIKAQVVITDLLTGMTTASEGSFEYQVLPKCSRECQ